jgi:hypothetical protein
MTDLPSFSEGTEMPVELWWKALWSGARRACGNGSEGGSNRGSSCVGNGWFTLPTGRIVVGTDIHDFPQSQSAALDRIYRLRFPALSNKCAKYLTDGTRQWVLIALRQRRHSVRRRLEWFREERLQTFHIFGGSTRTFTFHPSGRFVCGADSALRGAR